MSDEKVLELEGMASRHVGLTPAVAESYREAALVSLDRHHDSPQEFTLRFEDGDEKKASIDWEEPDERCKSAWANFDDATRDGAYACAIVATEVSYGLYTVRRAETLTGADYYVSPNEDLPDDLEDCLRLEVSGTALGEGEVMRRLRVKIKQAEEGKSSLPAIAVIVGFKAKLISSAEVEAP